MKRKLLFAILMIASVLGLRAQTDVTATYLTNADFSSTTGWTEYVSGSFKDYGNGLIGTYGVRTNEGQGVSTVDDTHLSTEYCFGFECRWSSSYSSFYQETTSLPIGHYELTFDVENTNSKTSSASYNNLFYVQVGNTKHTDSSTEWMRGKSSWTTHTISFDITAASTATISLGYGTGSNNIGSTNTPTIHVSHLKLTWSDPLQAAKDALSAEIAKAQLCDAKEGLASAIATAQNVLNTATTQAELEQALADLQAADKDAVLRYENGLADASATNGMLTEFVVNGTFDNAGNVSGWSTTGGFQNQTTATNQGGDFTVPFFENWNPSAKVNKMYQTINNIPNGTYKLKIAAFVNTLDSSTQYVFANSDKAYLTTGDPTFYEVWTVVTNNTIEIGLEQTTATANWMGIDNVSLTYYGAGDVINAAQAGSHKTDWEEALANAQAALANTDYANVTGSEKTALQTEVAKAEPTTAQGYDDAKAALNTATAYFTAAKASYDEYVSAKADAEALNATGVTAPTTAAEAETAAQTLKVNQYNKVVATYNRDVTSAYVGTWTRNQMDEIGGQHWSGDDRQYFDAWKPSGNSTATQTLSLPAGEYVLKVAGRGQANVTTVTMTAASKTVTFTSKGDTGLGIDESGAANFDASGTYANNNAGRGWEWRFIPLSLSETTDVEVTLSIVRASASWASFTDFAVLKVSTDATAADYSALNAAISAADGKTLGFEAGEYAPYTNVAAQKALAAAKAIDQTVANDHQVVVNATSDLNSATWTANSAWTQPIYNGMYATNIDGQNYPEGWARTNAWGAMQSGLSGDFATAYYNQPGSLVYGSTDYYSMPLPANQAFKLTFSYRSHENNSNYQLVVRVSNNGTDLIAPKFDGNGSTSEWKTDYAYFTTGAAGNYVIALENGGNTWMTNISLEKIASTADDLNGDGKIDEDDAFIADLKYKVGDLDRDGDADGDDLLTLVSVLTGKDVDYNANAADVNRNGEITIADVTTLVNGFSDSSLLPTVDDTDKYVKINATVYAEQKASENASDANYMINSAVNSLTNQPVSGSFDAKNYVTTLKIGVNLSNVKSVSVYAKGMEYIAGLMDVTVAGNATPIYTYSAGDQPSPYVKYSDETVASGYNKNMNSDVVTVTGDNAGTYTAYLLPVELSNGVTVTVRDSNGKFYSQDFTNLTIGAENNLTFTATTATNNWMATIPGNVNFSMLSTPGSHNSATSNCSSAAKCQSETIAQQLANGVRAFDIRPGYTYSSPITVDNLYIYHGMVNTNVLYKDAIAAMVEFLQAHPTEAISVIMVKEDGTPLLSSWTDYTTEMCNAISQIHNQYTDYLKLLDHSYYTLDDFRGKIFFGYRNAWDLHKTVRVTNWPDHDSVTNYGVGVGGLCSASVEDAYNTSGDSKKTVVNALLDLASANTDRSRFHYTFTSVANSITSQANVQNPAAATYINGLTGPTGYVYADFMGSSSYSGQTLLKAVIEQNYKYVNKGRSRCE